MGEDRKSAPDDEKSNFRPCRRTKRTPTLARKGGERLTPLYVGSSTRDDGDGHFSPYPRFVMSGVGTFPQLFIVLKIFSTIHTRFIEERNLCRIGAGFLLPVVLIRD